jgi:hypothetical protein
MFSRTGGGMRVRASVLWLIGLTSWLTGPFSAADAQAARRNAAVVIDGGWSGDYAPKACDQARAYPDEETAGRIRNSGCGAVAGCPEMMARVQACTSATDPKTQASQFEERLMRELAGNAGCKGAAFARYGGPDAKPPSAAEQAVMSKPHWEFSIDYVAGAARQRWSLQYLGEDDVAQGESATVAQMATDVCAVLFGQAAAPRR